MAKTRKIEKKSEINTLRENVEKMGYNLSMLNNYFVEQGIMEHYLAWYKALALETEKPPKLILPEKPKEEGKDE